MDPDEIYGNWAERYEYGLADCHDLYQELRGE